MMRDNNPRLGGSLHSSTTRNYRHRVRTIRQIGFILVGGTLRCPPRDRMTLRNPFPEEFGTNRQPWRSQDFPFFGSSAFPK